MAWSEEEFRDKTSKIQQLIVKERISGITLTTQTNFGWLTGGRSHINSATEGACGELLVTKQGVYLVANNIEASRLMEEELNGLPIEMVTYDWWENGAADKNIRTIAENGIVMKDTELGGRFAKLRWNLNAEEQLRYQEVGRAVGAVLETVAFLLRPGLTEMEIAEQIRMVAAAHGVAPNVALVAVDDRAFRCRHPLPTEKRLNTYAMLVLSGQKYGLYASATRLVHFGKPPEVIENRYAAVLQVEAALISATIAGARINDVLQSGIAAYEQTGFAGEWKQHHQGGMAGYASREIKADPTRGDSVEMGQAYAWNPTIAGVKVEDTFLVGAAGPIMLTASQNFPALDVQCGEWVLQRPAILIR